MSKDGHPPLDSAQPPLLPPQPGFHTQPPPGYDAAVHPPSAPAPTVYVSVPTTAIPVQMGPNSQVLTCPHCHRQVRSMVDSEPSSKTHLFALLLCLFGCWPCCCIPYCMDSCQNQNHSCPNCKAYLGTYSN